MRSFCCFFLIQKPHNTAQHFICKRMHNMLINEGKTMAEYLVESVEELCGDFNNKVDQINLLIKQLIEVREAINKHKRDGYYLESHFSALSMNVWAGQVKYCELQKKEVHIRKVLSDTTKGVDFKYQELRNLKLKRTKISFEQCSNFHNKYRGYADNFMNAQVQYSIQNLSEDLKHYQQEYKKLQYELLLQSKELENLEPQDNPICINTVEDVKEILIINTLKRDIMASNYYNKGQKIKFAEYTLEIIENKVKQQKALLNNCYK